MKSSTYAFWSTVGRKVLVAVTGLSLFLFVVGHLAGNLLLFVGPDAFNTYAHKLISLGGLLYVIESLLLGVFLIHVTFAISVQLSNWRAKPAKYAVTASQGSPSRMNLSSRTMIWTGLALFVFLAIHLKTFKYGPDISEGYVTTIDGVQVRDLYRLVAESFSDEVYAAGYLVAMVLLGFHLRHGFWSAFQSLGINHPRYTPIIYGVGVLAAVVLAIGFFVMPIWFYFGGPAR